MQVKKFLVNSTRFSSCESKVYKEASSPDFHARDKVANTKEKQNAQGGANIPLAVLPTSLGKN